MKPCPAPGAHHFKHIVGVTPGQFRKDRLTARNSLQELSARRLFYSHERDGAAGLPWRRRPPVARIANTIRSFLALRPSRCIT
jgi:hypothetical protein